jgi:hypothetical protein
MSNTTVTLTEEEVQFLVGLLRTIAGICSVTGEALPDDVEYMANHELCYVIASKLGYSIDTSVPPDTQGSGDCPF